MLWIFGFLKHKSTLFKATLGTFWVISADYEILKGRKKF